MFRSFLFAGLLLIASFVFLKPDAHLGLHPIEEQSRSIVLESSHEQAHMPIYYSLLSTWTTFTGDSIFAMRWLSTLWIGLGLAGLVRLCLFIKPKISPTAIMVFGTFSLPYFASVIHPASLIFTLSMASGAILFMWTESGNKRYLFAYALLGFLLLTASHYGLFGLLLHAVLLIEKYQLKTRRSQIPFIIFAIGIGIASLINRPNTPLTDYDKWLEWGILALPMFIFLSAWATSGAVHLKNPAMRQLIPVGLIVMGFIVGIGINTLLFSNH